MARHPANPAHRSFTDEQLLTHVIDVVEKAHPLALRAVRDYSEALEALFEPTAYRDLQDHEILEEFDQLRAEGVIG